MVGVGLGAVRRAADDAPLVGTLDDGREIEADEILVAIGRRPNTIDIGIDAFGQTPGKPLEVDDQLRVHDVDGGWLYAVGDVNGRAPTDPHGQVSGSSRCGCDPRARRLSVG